MKSFTISIVLPHAVCAGLVLRNKMLADSHSLGLANTQCQNVVVNIFLGGSFNGCAEG